jgi:ubiquinone/menaquinone biosynthesis C-methylase UbiE
VAVEIDRDGVELAALLAAADLESARVLEVGCGDGRLARRYAHRCRLVAGLDPDVERITAGRPRCPAGASLHFVCATSVPLPFRDEAFDVALFGWSL